MLRAAAVRLMIPLAVGCQTTAPAGRQPRSSGAIEDCTAEVSLDETSGTLRVALRLPPSNGDVPLWALPRTEAYFQSVRRVQGSGEPASVERQARAWVVEDCSGGCQVEYRFPLSHAIRRLVRWRAAERIGRSYIISPSAWLLMPDPALCPRLSIVLTSPENFTLTNSETHATELELATREGSAAPAIVLGPSKRTQIRSSNGALAVVVDESHTYAPAVFEWIEREAASLTRYFSRFPVPSAVLLLRPGRGGGAYHGSAHGHGAALLKISVNRQATAEDLHDDWELLHEFIHLCLPNLDRKHRWMEEGLSTYLGIAIRRRTGRIDPDRFWGELTAGFGNSIAPNRTVGFNSNATWGETYWGGALYFYRVDLAIHEATEGRLGLREVLHEVQRRGGDIRSSWPVEDLFHAEEDATGTSFLRKFHAEMGERRTSFDVVAEFEALGVRGLGRGVELVDDAPRSAVRKSFESWTIAP